MKFILYDQKQRSQNSLIVYLMVITLTLLLTINAYPQCLPYLGQNAPNRIPIRFVPDSMAANTSWQYHGTPTFSPSGDEMYYAIYRYNPGRVEIWFTKCSNGKWTQPIIAPFSNLNYENNNPVFSRHKDTLYFLSPRPTGFIHRVVRTNETWSAPIALALPIPQGFSTGLQFSIADNGNVYAELSPQGSNSDIYVWHCVNGLYQSPKKIETINTPELDFTPFVDPEEKFIIFCSRRPGGLGNTDMYISKRNSDNTWTTPKNVGRSINSGEVVSPIISRDGKFLFYDAWIDGAAGGNPYWVSAEVVTRLINDSTVMDIDGNIYTAITIGSQVWMAENLQTTRFANGETVTKLSINSQWSNSSVPAYCYYTNSVANSSVYGALYNWQVVSDSRKIAPTGWHIPSKEEWETLFEFLGGINVAAGKLKETGTVHWANPNSGATNEVGFSALPGGYRQSNGSFIGLGNIGSWWSADQSSGTEAWAVGMFNDAIYIDLGNYYDKKIGFSLRCIKDTPHNSLDIQTKRANQYYLNQNYPNPFNPLTIINYYIPVTTSVKLIVYDVFGSEVITLVDEIKHTGSYSVSFNGASFSSGIYYYQLQANNFIETKKFILLK